jgi:hypothetical protein
MWARSDGVTMYLPALDGDDAAKESKLETQLLNGGVSERIHATVLQEMETMQMAPAGPDADVW